MSFAFTNYFTFLDVDTILKIHRLFEMLNQLLHFEHTI